MQIKNNSGWFRQFVNFESVGLKGGIGVKINFFTGLTANVGANAGNVDIMYGHDDFTMLQVKQIID